MKSHAKHTVMKYKKGMNQTGGGVNTAKKPTDLQYTIASMLGPNATEGIANAQMCDSSIPESTRRALTLTAVEPMQTVAVLQTVSTDCTSTTPSSSSSTSASPAASSTAFLNKRRKTPRQQQLEQGEELLKTESLLMDAVSGVRDELQHTNSILAGILFEMKRSNELQQQAQAGSQAPNSLPPAVFY